MSKRLQFLKKAIFINKGNSLLCKKQIFFLHSAGERGDERNQKEKIEINYFEITATDTRWG